MLSKIDTIYYIQCSFLFTAIQEFEDVQERYKEYFDKVGLMFRYRLTISVWNFILIVWGQEDHGVID